MIESEWKITFSMSGEAWTAMLEDLKLIKNQNAPVTTMAVERIARILKIDGMMK